MNLCTEVLTLELGDVGYDIDTQDKDTDIKNRVDLVKKATQSVAFGACEELVRGAGLCKRANRYTRAGPYSHIKSKKSREK
jgi:hypothetical protein